MLAFEECLFNIYRSHILKKKGYNYPWQKVQNNLVQCSSMACGVLTKSTKELY